MKSKRFALAAILFVSLPLVALAAADRTDAVRIHSGLVAGETLADGVRVFRGIPFAAPPVGDLRWRPPQDVEAWSGVRDATRFGAVCPQPPTLIQMERGEAPEQSEDCLFLNVWTPATDPGASLPVMVWIHGGGLSLGFSHQAVYDGLPFARHGVVLVSVNYRLGALGFLAHPELSAESEHGASGNYGFLDQIAALEWVQRNIAAFGGDPDRVTIFGESAGGTSVFALVASPMTSGLVHRAIAQSPWVTETNVAYQTRPTPFVASAEEQGLAFATHQLGEGADLADLRELAPAAIVAKGGFSPIINVDGRFMPDAPEAIFAAGRQQDVPLIVGTNANEGTMFMGGMTSSLETFRGSIEGVFGEQAEGVLALYPAAAKEQLPEVADRYITEAWFLRPSRAMLRGHAKVKSPAYQYHFTRASRAIPAWGAHHAAELGYVFNTFIGFGPGAVEPDATDRELGAAMIEYWSSFAADGDPNTDGRPEWPAFAPASEAYLELGDEIRTGAKLGKASCDALDALRAAAGM
ncbi:MAG: carboxylesterase/lipase family protein [Thermoanaerobaculia bacterium]|nr:carboxylesterase/lipase family protein [Thermoanaerobaculia bacterium]